MSFIPPLSREDLETQRGAPPDLVAWPFVDELYDYMQLLVQDKPIASVPQSEWGKQVAIVGAGPAGIVAAYELLKLGLKPIVFESSDRIGGRNWSKPFRDPNGPSDAFAEMGAMRVPTQNYVFYYYVGLLGLAVKEFPDPGKVPTVLYYENKVMPWNPGEDPPGRFKAIGAAFNNFVMPLQNKIYEPWKQKNWAGVQAVWQQYIDVYRNKSFYEGIVDGIPGWKTEDLNAFGALGLGSGGFGPLYSVGFLELLRIIVNQFEVDQKFIETGISDVTNGLFTRLVPQPSGPQKVSLQGLDCVQLNVHVDRIEYNPQTGNPIVYWTNSSDPTEPRPGQQEYPAVILATTTRSMELLGLTALRQDNTSNVVSESVKTAIRNLHLMESSKLFIRTEKKFWLDDDKNPVPGMPQNIQTDELPRGVYCLDYEGTDNGVVLISYTWGDDSAKLLALSPMERFLTFKDILAIIHPQFAAELVPIPPGDEDQIYNVDWEAEAEYYGAFKLQYPGQDPYARDAYFQFQSVLDDSSDRGVYLAGDSVSWAGGWTEGALHTGLNAASAVVRRLGGSFSVPSPLTMNPSLYDYGD
jgi:tryptophan 2-monooxygenase